MKIAKEAQKQLETEYIQGKIDLIDEKWEDAFKHFDRVIRRDSDFFKAWHYKGVALDELGTALGEVGKYEESIACYDSTLQIEPKYELAKNNRILMLMSLERFEEAQEERKKQSSEKKEGFEKSKLSKKGKEERILEIDAHYEVINEMGDKIRGLLDAKAAYKKNALSFMPAQKQLALE